MKQEFNEPGYDFCPFGMPRGKGVYVVCSRKINLETQEVKKVKVVYVGSSVDIRRRVMAPSHIYRKLYDALSSTHSISVACLETDDHLNEEKRMIEKYRPKFNKQLNGFRL